MPLLFADLALAARIDAAEMRLAADIATAAAQLRPASRAVVLPVAGGQAVYAGPRSPANKVIGLGFGHRLDQDALDTIEAAWRERGEPVRFEVATLADASIPALLTRRGYILQGFENVLGRAIDDTGAGESGVCVIERLEADDQGPYVGVLVEGFAHPDVGSAPPEEYSRDVLDAVFSDMMRTKGFRRYLARVHGEPAGAAGMRLDHGLAQLCGAATRPAFRRRGIQSALFGRRVRDAHEAGCDLAVVTTEPGSKSQANATAQGFVLLYTRAVLVRE
jgi:ribosomal protein S18 acetylase RimI-like enzyme